jgi:hypothetical protein
MEQDLLKLTARNTRPKYSFQLILSGIKSEFTIRNEASIKLDRDSRYEVALVNIETYYSFANVDVTNNLLRYSADDGRTWHDTLVPEGSYKIDNISKTTVYYMKQRKIIMMQRGTRHSSHCQLIQALSNLSW